MYGWGRGANAPVLTVEGIYSEEKLRLTGESQGSGVWAGVQSAAWNLSASVALR